MSSEDDTNLARLVLVDLEMHRQKTEEKVEVGSPDLNYAHQRILDKLDYDEWTDRRDLMKNTGFRRKQLKKHVTWLEDHDYVEERKKPQQRRKIQYRRVS